MNGNRTKYTYTPTYGMQKRGILKKGAPVKDVPETPDFTQVPDPTVGVPLQPTMQQAYVQPQVSTPQPANMTMPSYFTTAPQTPVQSQQTVQMPFVAPTFVQQSTYQQYPPVQHVQPAYQQPPLGNSIQNQSVPTGFSPRSQGFVPPKPQPAVVQPQSQMPPAAWTPTRPSPSQSIPPFAGMSPAASNQPFQQSGPSYPPFQPAPQQNGFAVQSAAVPVAPRAAALDADKLWTVFLFGILPLLFAPCLFVTSAWDALRYAFIGATVIGLGVMWYRQLYTPVVRSITSMIYAALCIVTIAVLMQGTGDARQAATNLNNTQQQVTQQSSPVPNNSVVDTEMAPTPTPSPTVAPPSEAERRLSLFMELWKVNNTTEMVNLVQPSWRSQQQEASSSLFFVLGTRTPEDFLIEDISGSETDNSRTITMRATINKNTGKAPVVYRFMVMMVKEGGEWYVNPNSLASNDVAEEQDQEQSNVVKTQGSGTVTEPPRETVTPAPPASTMLYYNLRGNFYHMDPNCPSVGKDYLPFDASFPYSELKSYNNTYLPCLSCNAPVDPL